MKSPLKKIHESKCLVFDEQNQRPQPSFASDISRQLKNLKQAKKENIALKINEFLLFIEKQNLLKPLDHPQLTSFWEDLFDNQTSLFVEAKLCKQVPHRLPDVSPFRQLLGYYYYSAALKPEGKRLDLLEKAMEYGNEEAAKAMALHWISQLQNAQKLSPSMHQELPEKIRKYLLPLQTVGYLLGGQVLKSLAAYLVKKTQEDELGWRTLGEAIQYLFVAEELAALPHSKIILMNAYGTADLTAVWTGQESPVLLNTDPEKAVYASVADYRKSLVQIYHQQTGWPTEELLNTAKKYAASLQEKFSLESRVVQPKKIKTEPDLDKWMEILFSPPVSPNSSRSVMKE